MMTGPEGSAPGASGAAAAPSALTRSLAAALDAMRRSSARWPRLAALHRPPLTAGAAGREAEFAAVALDDGRVGLVYLLLDDLAERIGDDAEVARFLQPGACALAAADGVTGTDLLGRAIGFATLNALAQGRCEARGWSPPAAPDSLAGLPVGPGTRVGMVGWFPPLVDEVLRRGGRLTVLERKAPRLEVNGWRWTDDASALADAQVLLVTSTVLVNDSFDAIRAAAPAAARFALVGPGALAWPPALFDAGVDVLAGRWIVDAPAVISALREGRRWGEAARKFTWAPGSGPDLARPEGSGT